MARLGVKIRKRQVTKSNKSKRKHQKPKGKFRTRFVGDASLQKTWDPRLTLRQNYANLGLQVNPNSFQEIQKDVREAEEKTEDEVFLYHVPDSDDFLKERNGRRPEHHMSEEEIKYLRPLITKYQEDFKQMERDTKLNNLQWTENKLKRRCARLALLDAKVILRP